MAIEHANLFMMFQPYGGGDPIEGECRVELRPKDARGRAMPASDLLTGFKAGHFFEINKFSMSASTQDANRPTRMKPGQDHDRERQQMIDEVERLKRMMYDLHGAQRQASAPTATHQTQASRQTAQVTSPPVGEITFSKPVDASSFRMMYDMINKTGYKRATLIKRKSVGGFAAGETYLRVDFDDILVTGIDWTDDEKINENYKFICRGVHIRYKPQLPDGSLGGVIPGDWFVTDPQDPPP